MFLVSVDAYVHTSNLPTVSTSFIGLASGISKLLVARFFVYRRRVWYYFVAIR